MEENSSFIDQLSQALTEKRQVLESEELPKLKEQFRLTKTSFETVTTVLQRKNLLNEDPYKYETKISGVEIPDDSMFGDFERDDEMSIRVSHYDGVLEYVVNYYEFTVDHMDLKELKQILGFATYIKWEQFNPQINSPTTRTLADLVGRLRGGGDSLSTNLINDALQQLSTASTNIKRSLRALADFQKEAYKLRLRTQLLQSMDIGAEEVATSRDSVISKVRKRFAEAMPGEPFIADLVTVTLDEDYSPDSEDLHAAVLRKMAVQKKERKQTDNGAQNRALLMEAVHAASAASRPILDAVAKLNDNNEVLKEQQVPLGERVRRFFQKLSGRNEDEGHYDVEYFDETTGAKHTEQIEYETFIERVTKKGKLYSAIASGSGSAAQQLKNGPEEKVFEYLNKDLSELYVIHRQLKSLDTFFKSEVPRENRNRLRGIKIELTTIKNHLMKAGQKRREYIARKEEAEQLKRLGIDSQ